MKLPDLVHQITTDPAFAQWVEQQLESGEAAGLNLDRETTDALRALVNTSGSRTFHRALALDAGPTVEWYSPTQVSSFSPA